VPARTCGDAAPDDRLGRDARPPASIGPLVACRAGQGRQLLAGETVTDPHAQPSRLVDLGPESNAVLKKIADKLPIRWEGDKVVVGSKSFAAETHAPVLIYPNPLNPSKYVVLNSGFTYREYDYLNNARQVPKLPDWAIIDITTPPDSRSPGKVVAADFFGEEWELKPARD
jgi:hypothetical protein